MNERVERVAEAMWGAGLLGFTGKSWSEIDGHPMADAYRDEARAAIAALDADSPLEDVLLSSGLVSELPGYGIHIAYSGEKWHVSQEYCGLSETFDTGIVGTGATVAEAIRAAVAAAQGDE